MSAESNDSAKADAFDADKQVRAYMESLSGVVMDRARERAHERGPGAKISPWDVAEAAREYTRGAPVSELVEEEVAKRIKASEKWWAPWVHSISAVTIISAILAVTFGALAIIGVMPAGSSPGGSGATAATGATSTGFLDIAKIFAGAVAGSAATGAVAEARTRRPSGGRE